ncbi:MAG TPA: response regulator transcription factor [Candidatus Acidoferrum sp.]|nr:response regulator transcription factor [Candidatus Acidoferrum sp.]
MATIRVLLADDNAAMLTDLQDELSKEFQIVGTVDNGNDVVDAIARLDPDVLVLDMTMPGLNGIQVASRLRSLHVRTKILFLTIHEQAEYISAAFSVGANGYVSKRSLARELAPAIRAVFAGEKYLSPSLDR